MFVHCTHCHCGQRSAAVNTIPVSIFRSVFLSDMLMLLILIGNSTEPSTDKKTMLAAPHRFLPGALRGVLQAVLEFMGFSQSVVSWIVLTASSGLGVTVCFYHSGWQIALCETSVCIIEFVHADGTVCSLLDLSFLFK